MTARTWLVVATMLLAAGCGDGASAAAVQDGTYRLFATSAQGGLTAAGAPQMTIADDTVTLTEGADTATATLGEPTGQLVVCPPSGQDSPVSLDRPLSVGAVGFRRPALVGDCGQTTPMRVTLVDLAAPDTSLGFPFTRWAEFCDLTDPDC
ncbi:MAG: hypothetical protein WCA29_13610 [Jiangellales bacterium]